MDRAELERCRALLRIDPVPSTPKEDEVTSKVKQPNANKDRRKEKSSSEVEPVSPADRQSSSKKGTKVSPAVTSTAKPVEVPLVPTTKAKKEKSTPLPVVELPDEVESSNNSVVDRAFHFVKNIFQLSDDILEMESAPKEPIIDLIQEQQRSHHHHSRKLLSIDNFNDEQCELPPHQSSSLPSVHEPVEALISKRQLLSTKTSKSSAKTNRGKEKKSKSAEANKPKVGWAYRYRISRFLAAQKTPRAGKRNKLPAAGKGKPLVNTKAVQKKSTSSGHSKVTRRKLLEHRDNDEM